MTSLSQDSYLSPNNCLFLRQTPFPNPDELNGSLYITQDLGVGVDALIENNLGVGGELEVIGSTLLEADVTINGATTLNGSTTLNSTLTANGESTFSGIVNTEATLNAGGAVNIAGDLTAEAATILNGDLSVTAAAEFTSTLDVTGDTTLAGLTVNNDLSVDGTTTINGALRAQENIACPVYSNEIPQPTSGSNAYILGFGVLIPNPVDPETSPTLCEVLYSGADGTDYYFVSRNGVGLVADVWGVLTAGGRIPGVGFTVQSSAIVEIGTTFNYLILKGNVVESSSLSSDQAKATLAQTKISNTVALGYTETEARRAVLREENLIQSRGANLGAFLTSKGYLATESFRYALNTVQPVAPVIPAV